MNSEFEFCQTTRYGMLNFPLSSYVRYHLVSVYRLTVFPSSLSANSRRPPSGGRGAPPRSQRRMVFSLSERHVPISQEAGCKRFGIGLTTKKPLLGLGEAAQRALEECSRIAGTLHGISQRYSPCVVHCSHRRHGIFDLTAPTPSRVAGAYRSQHDMPVRLPLDEKFLRAMAPRCLSYWQICGGTAKCTYAKHRLNPQIRNLSRRAQGSAS